MAPQLNGYHIIWADDFKGGKGSLIDDSNYKQVANTPTPTERCKSTPNVQVMHTFLEMASYISSPFWRAATQTSIRLQPVVRLSGHEAAAPVKPWYFRPRSKCLASPHPSQVRWHLASFLELGRFFTHRESSLAQVWPTGNLRSDGQAWRSERGTLHFIDTAGNKNCSSSCHITYQGGGNHTWVIKVDRRKDGWKKQALIWHLDGK